MQPITLVMDTSNSPLLLAVEKDGKIFKLHRKGIKQEKLLFPALHKLLDKAGVSLPAVERVFIIRGPGRFTGIRISLTVASMLQMLSGAQVGGATVFEVLARQAQHSRLFQKWQKLHPQGVLAVVLHAFREEYFLQIFDPNSQGPQWLDKAALQNCLAAYSKPLFLVGTDRAGASLEELFGNKYPLAAAKDCVVRAETLCQLAQEGFGAAHALEPLYLKPARFELIHPQ